MNIKYFYWLFLKFKNWIKTMPALEISVEKDTYPNMI